LQAVVSLPDLCPMDKRLLICLFLSSSVRRAAQAGRHCRTGRGGPSFVIPHESSRTVLSLDADIHPRAFARMTSRDIEASGAIVGPEYCGPAGTVLLRHRAATGAPYLR